jgi:hypothetical protein
VPEHVELGGCQCSGCVAQWADDRRAAFEAAGMRSCVVHLAAEETVPAAPGGQHALCEGCMRQWARELSRIEAGWADATDALHRSGGGRSERKADVAIGSAAPIDLGASDALLAGTRAVAALAAYLAELPSTTSWPRDVSTPMLADWISRRHIETLARHPDSDQVLEWYTATQAAASLVQSAAARGLAEVYTPKACGKPLVEPGADGRVHEVGRCAGVIVVREGPAKAWAECSLDPTHAVDLDVWLRAMRAARPQQRTERTRKLVGARLAALARRRTPASQ